MAAVPDIRPPYCLPFGEYMFFFYIYIIFGKSSFAVRRGTGVVEGLITWHNWISIFLLDVVFGMRPPKYIILCGGWGG